MDNAHDSLNINLNMKNLILHVPGIVMSKGQLIPKRISRSHIFSLTEFETNKICIAY